MLHMEGSKYGQTQLPIGNKTASYGLVRNVGTNSQLH